MADVIPITQPKVYTKTDLINLVYNYAEEYKVNPKILINVINCEDNTWNPEKQSDIVKNGIREESYGLSQINIPSNPSVTIKQAQDPEFALDFMANNIAKGKGNKWSCYRKIYN